MLRISNLSKTYPNGVKALNNVTLNIGKGIFGLLGPNGAGKSSLIRTIATLQEADSGSICFEGIDVLTQKEQMRHLLGYLPQEFGAYPTVSAEDMLHHLAVLKGMVVRKERKETVDALLELANLYPYRKMKLGAYSGGMKQRFGIAQALIGSPRIVILDEPTAGLDPVERDRFHNLLSAVGENSTVVLSTHIVSDVTELCNDMAIIQNGEVIFQSPPRDAIRKLQGKIWKISLSKERAESYAQKYQTVSSRLLHGLRLLKVFSDSPLDFPFETVEPDLEDVYFSFTKSYIGA